MVNSEDIIKDVVEGATKGVINSGREYIKELVDKFRNRKLAFIGEKETIERVKEQLKSNEHSFYQTYIKDKKAQNCAVMGLTLRKLDSPEEIKRRENLIKKIIKTYEIKGLHISYLVQNGVLNRYLTKLIEELESEDILKEEINNFLTNVEDHTYFVKKTQSPENVAEEIKTKIIANSPKIFIISGMGSASKIVEDAFEIIKNQESIRNYSYERYSQKNKEIIFLNKENIIEGLE